MLVSPQHHGVLAVGPYARNGTRLSWVKSKKFVNENLAWNMVLVEHVCLLQIVLRQELLRHAHGSARRRIDGFRSAAATTGPGAPSTSHHQLHLPRSSTRIDTQHGCQEEGRREPS